MLHHPAEYGSQKENRLIFAMGNIDLPGNKNAPPPDRGAVEATRQRMLAEQEAPADYSLSESMRSQQEAVDPERFFRRQAEEKATYMSQHDQRLRQYEGSRDAAVRMVFELGQEVEMHQHRFVHPPHNLRQQWLQANVNERKFRMAAARNWRRGRYNSGPYVAMEEAAVTQDRYRAHIQRSRDRLLDLDEREAAADDWRITAEARRRTEMKYPLPEPPPSPPPNPNPSKQNPPSSPRFAPSPRPETRHDLAVGAAEKRSLVGEIQRADREQSYPLEKETNPTVKARVESLVKDYAGAKTEEDRMIAEGNLMWEGVDIEASKDALKAKKPPIMTPKGSLARLVNAVMGFFKLTAGLLRKWGGKKTEVKKEEA